jgi:hypothetical protein
MKRFALAALLLCALPAHANDSAFSGVGGSMKPMKGQHSTVRMERERIVIDAYANRYVTTVDFVFHNQGHKNVATMGFPESNYGDVEDNSKKSAFLFFKTWVDGVPFKAVRTAKRSGGDWEYDAYWVKTVPFARGQRRKVRVQYASPYGGTAMLGFSRAIQYVFTGQNWRGGVARSDMEVRLHTPGRWLMMTMWSLGEKESVPLSWKQHGNTFSRSWSNWQAQGNILVGIVPARKGWLVNKGMATDKTSIWGRSIQQSHEIVIPGRDTAGVAPFEGFPIQGFVQNGVTYVQLGYLVSELRDATEKLPNSKLVDRIKLTWDGKTRTRTLNAGKTSLAWRENARSFTVNGKAAPLPAATFVMNGELYVPAANAVRALGGSVRSNATQHWIELKMKPANF